MPRNVRGAQYVTIVQKVVRGKENSRVSMQTAQFGRRSPAQSSKTSNNVSKVFMDNVNGFNVALVDQRHVADIDVCTSVDNALSRLCYCFVNEASNLKKQLHY